MPDEAPSARQKNDPVKNIEDSLVVGAFRVRWGSGRGMEGGSRAPALLYLVD